MDSVRRILILVALAGLLGASANAISPRGLSWSRPLGRGVSAQVADAGLAPVGLKDVRALLQDRAIVFIDSRPREDFANGRLPGAKNIPWKEIEDGGPPPALPKGRLVLYCANEFCESSLRLGELLRKQGHRDVAVFIEGFEAWWNAGGAVDQD